MITPEIKPAEQPPAENPVQITAFVGGLYSSNLRFGIWCYLIEGGEPVHGFIDDPRSRLTHNMVEYQAVLELLRSLPDITNLTISSDSRIVMLQLLGRMKVFSPNIAVLVSACLSAIHTKRLSVKYELIPKPGNLAGLHLRKNRVKWSGEHEFKIPIVLPETGRKPASRKSADPGGGAPQ